jgi:hypothetical protein
MRWSVNCQYERYNLSHLIRLTVVVVTAGLEPELELEEPELLDELELDDEEEDAEELDE